MRKADGARERARHAAKAARNDKLRRARRELWEPLPYRGTEPLWMNLGLAVLLACAIGLVVGLLVEILS